VQENIQIARTSFDSLNAHDLDANDRLQSDDVKFEGPGAAGTLNRAQSRAYTQGFLTAFPDLHFDVTQIIAQDDYVVVNWKGVGTHQGPLVTPSGNSIPPTGKKSTVPGSSTFEIKHGKIVSSRIYWDMVTLLGQLGLMPPM